MENSQQLATESFSYSWLIDRKPCSSDGNSSGKEQNFHFDVPFTGSSIDLVHADEIFSDGHIMPVYADRPKLEPLKTSTSAPPSPISSSRSSFVANKSQYFSLGRWRNPSKKLLQKCFGFMKPLCRTIGCSRKSNRVDDLDRKVCEVQSWSNSLEASPRPRSAYSAVDWSDVKKISKKVDLHYGLKRVRSQSSSPQVVPRLSPSYSTSSCCDVESSIHEAILYCKRSIEK